MPQNSRWKLIDSKFFYPMFIIDSENVSSNCDKKSSNTMVPNNTNSTAGFTSLEYSCNGEAKDANDESSEVVRREGKKSIPFVRHSVHQINLSNKVNSAHSLLCS